MADMPWFEEKRTSLRDSIPTAWMERSDWPATAVRLHPSSFARMSTLDGFAPGKQVLDVFAAHPVDFNFIRLEQEASFPAVTSMVNYTGGQRTFYVQLTKQAVPPGEYCMIMSPLTLNETGAAQEAAARRAMDMCRGYLTALCGTSIAEVAVVETHLSHNGDSGSAVSQVWENYPSPETYRFLDDGALALLAERVGAHCAPEIRERFRTALHFLERTAKVVDANTRFSSAWIALEIACGGEGQAEKLVRELKDVMLIDLFLKLKKARNDLFHYGKSYEASREEERFMRAFVLLALCKRFRLDDRISLKPMPESAGV